MNAYAVALFFHFVSVLIAMAAASAGLLIGLRIRRSGSASEALGWIATMRRIIPAFPVAVVGLLATGGYMTHAHWSWSKPWIDAAVVGLALIIVAGSGVEGGRMRVLQKELESAGVSERARRLLCDPVSWSAKMVTFGLVFAVVFVMTVKPAAVGSVTAIVLGVVAGVLGAVPFWRSAAEAVDAPDLVVG